MTTCWTHRGKFTTNLRCTTNQNQVVPVRVVHANESCHTYEWVMSHIHTRRVAYVNKSRHAYNKLIVYVMSRHDFSFTRSFLNIIMFGWYHHVWMISSCLDDTCNHPTRMRLGKSTSPQQVIRISWHGVATMSRLPKNISLFCKRAL